MINIEMSAKLLDLRSFKLGAVIRDDYLWDSISSNDVLPKEANDVITLMLIKGLASTHLLK